MIRKAHTPEDDTSDALIGCAAHVQRLTAALGRAVRGSGQVVLLSGAMGVGKSRLAQELLTIASRRGHLVLTSRAYPLDEHLVYAPVITSLGPHLRQLEPQQQAELVAGLPYLSRLIDGLPVPPSQPVQAPALDKVRLFENVARLVERIADQQPTVWFIDDLHWADQASVELLYYVARNLRHHRVLLLVAYRNDDGGALQRLRLPLLALARRGLSEEVTLERLAPTDVAVLTRQRLGARPSRTLLAYLEARAAGNPLIVESLLRSLSERELLTRVGGAVSIHPTAAHRPPVAAREVILERVVRLDPQERRALDFLAVMGGTARQDELERAIGSQDPVLSATLGQLQAAGFIGAHVSDVDDSVSVHLIHPSFQEVLYAELPSIVRRQYHAQIAGALESLSPIPLERLARQYEGAGGKPDSERALQVLLGAAERATLAADPTGPRYYRAALALVRSGIRPELLPTVLQHLGHSLAYTGEFSAARECLLEALQMPQLRGDRLAAGRLNLHMAWVEFASGDLRAAGACIDAGIEWLGGGGWSPELLTLHGLRFTQHLMRSDTATVSMHVAMFDEAARSLGTPAALAWHSHARVWEELLAGRVGTGLSRAAGCLEQAWLSHDPILILLATADRGLTLLLRGDHRQAAAELGATLDRLPDAHSLPAGQGLRAMLAMAENLAGNWEGALLVSDDSAPLEPWLQMLPRANLGARAVALIRKGELAQAEACLNEVPPDPLRAPTEFEYAEALLALERGEYERAAETAGRLNTWSLAPLGLALQAEALAALGEVNAVRPLAAALTAIGTLDLPLAAALGAWTTGLAERTAGAAEAADAFAQAAAGFEALAMPFDAARAQFEQAQLVAAVDHRGASALARRSLATFTSLGAKLWAERVRRWLNGPIRHSRAPERRTGAPFSARELEIVRLLDAGLTNAQIAVRLVLSPRTVSNHLDRMFIRHGVNNRLSLVRVARGIGLLPA